MEASSINSPSINPFTSNPFKLNSKNTKKTININNVIDDKRISNTIEISKLDLGSIPNITPNFSDKPTDQIVITPMSNDPIITNLDTDEMPKHLLNIKRANSRKTRLDSTSIGNTDDKFIMIQKIVEQRSNTSNENTDNSDDNEIP